MNSGRLVTGFRRLTATGVVGIAVTTLVAAGLWVGADSGVSRVRGPDGFGGSPESTDPDPADQGRGDDSEADGADAAVESAAAGPSVLGVEEEADPPEVDEVVVADFSLSTSQVLVGDQVVFIDTSGGDPTSWSWDFGDGTGDSSADVVKSWSSAGTYVVTLNVADAVSSDSTSVTVTVLEGIDPPTAIIEVGVDNVATGEPVLLRSVSTGGLLEILWDFGDGGAGTAAEVTHAYSQPGSYVVTLIVSNPAGSSTATAAITVFASTAPPVAVIDPHPGLVEAGLPATLASASLNDPDTLEWDFGDGSTGSGTPVTHTWAAEGIFEVTLQASNEAGSSSTSVIVTVLPYLPPPVASFAAPASAPVGTEVDFVDSSTDAVTWSWDFGDGGSATSSSASHTYSSTGTFVVGLTVTNRNGSDTATATIEVLPPPPPPVAQFTPSAETVGTGEPVIFTNTSTGAASYSWDFGDGNTSTGVSPTHAYTNPGAYTVVLTATNSVGETDTADVKIRVNRGS